MVAAKPNAVRGEFALQLGGVTYQLRTTHEAQEAIEETLDRSLVELANAAFGGKLKLREVAVIAAEFIAAWGRQTSDELVSLTSADGLKPHIHAAGVATVMKALHLPLGMAVTGGVTSTGEPRPEALPGVKPEKPRAGKPAGENAAA